MAEDPIIDGRDGEALEAWVSDIAPEYTPEWNPDSPDAGTALLSVFGLLAGGVIDRLDRVPGKHRLAFLDALGFERDPPQAARLPLQFRLSEAATANVPLSERVQATARTEDGDERVFELVDGGFEATPATLTDVLSVDPGTEQIFTHPELLEGDTTPLFRGDNEQVHVLYVGHDTMFELEPGSRFDLRLRTATPGAVLRSCLDWEYYGEAPGEDGDAGWHPLLDRTGGETERCQVSETAHVEAMLDHVEPYMRRYGYERAGAVNEWTHRELVRSIAEDVREGRFDGSIDSADGDDHGLVRNLVTPGESRPRVLRFLQSELTLLEQRLTEGGDIVAPGEDPRDVRLTFEIPGAATPCEVDGRTTHWIRCRVPPTELSKALFEFSVAELAIAVGPDTHGDAPGLAPDAAFANDVPLSLDGPVYPFSRDPGPASTFYVASAEAFTKAGATVDLWFEPDETVSSSEPTDGGADPGEMRGDVTAELSWEYWNGTNWGRLAVTDDLNALTESGRVRFTVPRDMDAKRVAGQERRWVRARVISGDYGQPKVEQTADGDYQRTTAHIRPPRFGGVAIRYGHSDRPTTLRTYNNLEHSGELQDSDAPLRPFVGLGDGKQRLYLGFDRPLSGGPVQLFVPVRGAAYPASFYPRLRWEYCVDPERDRWAEIEVEDGTEGLTERGILSLVFPEPTTACTLFGRRRHWLRARVTRDEFEYTTEAVFERQSDGGTARSVRELRTEQLVHREARTPPVLRGLYSNTAWAHNLETIGAERLGASNGVAAQSFDTAQTPVLSERVWVDERRRLSEPEQRELARERPDDVELETTAADEVRACWVRWTRVADLAGSGADDRHYTLDRLTGEVTFGDGKHGRVPPSGRDNVRIDYATGGGVDGNVSAGAVGGLRESPRFVDDVTNPEPADGGADAEPLAAVRDRASSALRDRGRAVTAADYERVARAASRELARVTCEPGIDRVGERTPGWVTLLVVPQGREPRPVPSVELRQHVHEAVSALAPATLSDGGDSRLVVAGPSYVAVSVDTTIELQRGRSISALETRTQRALCEFFHPLTGNETGDGWDFGSLPHLSDLYALVEGLDGIDQVDDLSMTFHAVGSEATVTDGESNPTVGPDALVCNGRHEITVTRGRT